ncbi:MAG: extracellular solute-binding protein [Bacillota bacterium]|jgi:ABC-type glycerol-3-phosphate transport system substrate-binding protein
MMQLLTTTFFRQTRLTRSAAVAWVVLCLLLSAVCIASETRADSAFEIEIEYAQYISRHSTAARPALEVVIPLADYVSSDMRVEVLQDFEGMQGESLWTDEYGYVEWEIDVPQAGLYNIEITYYPVEGHGSDIQRQIEINGEIPFFGARHLSFPRVWKDAGEIRVDNRGNHIRAALAEEPMWQTAMLKDHMGYYMEPYLFYFEQGINRIRLVSQKEPVVLGQIRLLQAERPPTYAEISSLYDERGYRPAQDFFLKIQAEDAKYKSEQTLYPVHDKGDPSLEPYHPVEIRLNSIGGYSWQRPGQWISWEFEVPEDGLYMIALKSKQNLRRGTYSNRRLYIDGKVPFQEVDAVRFKFTTMYDMKVLGMEEIGEPFLFYLTKGKHELKLEVVLGDLADILRRTEESLYEINRMYRSILAVTSAAPDPMRDYRLDKRVPKVIENLKIQSDVIYGLSRELVEYTGQRGDHIAVLDRLAWQLNNMAERPDTIPRRLSEYRDNIGALGTWILQTSEQPLQLDYIVVASPDSQLPRATPTVWELVLHEIKAYFGSYVFDYEQVGNVYDPSDPEFGGRKPLTVWISSGRDQAQQLKTMIEDAFTPFTGIPVNLELVNMGVLLPATLAGRGPDVALGVATSDPINLALRGAVVDLTQFDDFDEVRERFMESALVPFTFRDSVYALPEQQHFPVMFYRKDIFQELGLEVPQTWDDVIKLIPELQKQYMDFGLPVSDERLRRSFNAHDIGMATAGAGSLAVHRGALTFMIFLYQRGGELYLPDGVASALNSEEAVDAFRLWTNLYELYKLPLQYDAANRFRIGEMPILIDNYGLYNTLSVFAPEIKGRWEFTLVPGTRREDGTIDRTVPASTELGGAGCIILSHTEDKQAAWEFLKWWTSTETQVRYGKELESLMGPAARYATANVEALRSLPWTVEELRKLDEQWQYVKGVPEVPGGYMTGRHLDNAFRKVVYQKREARKTLLDYVRVMNEELEIKRQEFGLETDVQKVLEMYKAASSQ